MSESRRSTRSSRRSMSPKRSDHKPTDHKPTDRPVSKKHADDFLNRIGEEIKPQESKYNQDCYFWMGKECLNRRCPYIHNPHKRRCNVPKLKPKPRPRPRFRPPRDDDYPKARNWFRIINETNSPIYIRGRDMIVFEGDYHITNDFYRWLKVPNDVRMYLNNDHITANGLKAMMDRFSGFDIQVLYNSSTCTRHGEEEYSELCIYYNIKEQRWLVRRKDNSGKSISVEIYPCDADHPTQLRFF